MRHKMRFAGREGAIHLGIVHDESGISGSKGEHGWQRPMSGQRVRGATLANGEIRRSISVEARNGVGSAGGEWLLTDNETNSNRLYGAAAAGPFKDAFHDYLVDGRKDALAANHKGTKAAAHFRFEVPGRQSVTVQFRLSRLAQALPFARAEQLFAQRIAEADEFYADLQRDIEDADAKHVQRQALAGMIWSKQYFYFDIPEWINGDAGQTPPPAERRNTPQALSLAQHACRPRARSRCCCTARTGTCRLA